MHKSSLPPFLLKPLLKPQRSPRRSGAGDIAETLELRRVPTGVKENVCLIEHTQRRVVAEQQTHMPALREVDDVAPLHHLALLHWRRLPRKVVRAGVLRFETHAPARVNDEVGAIRPNQQVALISPVRPGAAKNVRRIHQLTCVPQQRVVEAKGDAHHVAGQTSVLHRFEAGALCVRTIGKGHDDFCRALHHMPIGQNFAVF